VNASPPRPPASLELLTDVVRRAGVSAQLRGSADVRVSAASDDSRSLSEGELFLARRGTRSDAHDHVAEAVRKGAVAAVVERYVDVAVPQLRVSDGRRAAAVIAHFLEGEPSRRMRVTAVTGTNGKTTSTLLIRHILAAEGPAATIGTLGLVGPDGSVRPGSEGLTTPGPVRIARFLHELVDEGVTAVTLEASSIALEQRRLDGIEVSVAVFTNFTQDHLDYHGTLEAYREAKARLLLLVGGGGGVVVNGEAMAWAELPPIDSRLLVSRFEEGSAPGRPACLGATAPDLVARDVALTGEGSRFRVRWGGDEATVSLPLLGRFNVENALSALGAALLLGVSLAEGARRLSDAPAPVGRMEVTVREPVPVILDYAHTPDALRRVLEAVRPLYSGRVILVFGAGGDRDKTKRPEMGGVAARGADLAIVTSDNPRTEDPEAIVDDIAAGMRGASYERITDRREAIARALQVARPGDVVILAGKGHETYQIVGTERRPFDERTVVKEILGSGRAA
jgi:UDP-N-acetylmuramoyl-L-alanyl-D-glutamate--2,6-diaminopimelate ligase